MYVGDSLITLRNIERRSLDRVLGWYNTADEYHYATGTYGYVALETLEEKFDSVNDSDNEIFLGIYKAQDNELAGIILASLVQGALWIKLLTVAMEYRRMGFGSASIGMLLKYFKETGCASDCYLSVAEENETGWLFWMKNGFREVSRLEKRTLPDSLEHNIIIMQKSI